MADKRVDFTYNLAGQLATIERYSDLGAVNLVATSVYTYNDDLGWLAGLVHTINNTNQDVITYGYDYEADGQISSIDSSEEGEYDYTYDEQGQLTDVTLDAGSGAESVEHYEYDAGGNRTSTTAGSSSSAYATGQYNRLESVDDGTDITCYGYDAEGNVVLKFIDANENGEFDSGDTDIVEYAWDHRNRLIGVDTFDDFGDYDDYEPGVTDTRSQAVDYAYDYLNRLVSRTADEDGSGATFSPVTEYFVHDGDAATNWALEDSSTSEDGTIPFGADPATDAGQIVLRLDEAGDPTHRYLWGPAVDMLLADEVLSPLPSGEGQGEGGVVRWPLTDHQNSVRDIVVLDDNGTPANPADDQWIVENHITYDACGNKISYTGAVDSIFGFTGRMHDELTGLNNNTNRWYDPLTARWQSEDPIGFDGDIGNSYRYCGNDPANWIDPSGLEFVPIPDYLIRQMGGEATIAQIKAGLPGNADLLYDPITREIGYRPRGSNVTQGLQETIDQHITQGKAGWKPGARGAAGKASRQARGRGTARVMAAYTVYATLKEALQQTGHLQPDYEVNGEFAYYFVDKQGNVFVVQEAGWFTSAKRIYVAGPRAGESVSITSKEVERYRREGEKVWGKYIPGSLFREPRFIPGSARKRLDLIQVTDRGYRMGYIDEDGVHWYNNGEPIGF